MTLERVINVRSGGERSVYRAEPREELFRIAITKREM